MNVLSRTGALQVSIYLNIRFVGILTCFVLTVQPFPATAQGAKGLSLAEIAVYNGPDRERILVAGAKKEGKLMWYTSLAGGSYKELAKSFEAKYGVPVEVYRASSKDIIARVLAEAQSRRFLVDAVESSPPLLMVMRTMNLLTPYNFPSLATFPAESKEETGKGTVYWATDRESYIGFAYNKTKLPANAVPKNHEDLLNPALKGKMGFATSDTGTRTVGAMLKFKGEEYVRKLAKQELSMHALSAQALLDLIISGEVESSPTIFRNHVLVASERKAPVAWGFPWRLYRRAREEPVLRLRHRIRTPRFYLSIFFSARTGRRFWKITNMPVRRKNTVSSGGISKRDTRPNNSKKKVSAGESLFSNWGANRHRASAWRKGLSEAGSRQTGNALMKKE